jgi:hypothetical protein
MATYTPVSRADVVTVATAAPNVTWRLVSSAQAVSTTGPGGVHMQPTAGPIIPGTVRWFDTPQ